MCTGHFKRILVYRKFLGNCICLHRIQHVLWHHCALECGPPPTPPTSPQTNWAVYTDEPKRIAYCPHYRPFPSKLKQAPHCQLLTGTSVYLNVISLFRGAIPHMPGFFFFFCFFSLLAFFLWLLMLFSVFFRTFVIYLSLFTVTTRWGEHLRISLSSFGQLSLHILCYSKTCWIHKGVKTWRWCFQAWVELKGGTGQKNVC